MAKADKATAVADIAEQFKDATAALVTEYRGLTVANLAELRHSLGDSATYSVAKNTLIRRAATEAGVDGLDELFVGPTAIAFVTGEAVDAAKALKKFAKDHKALVIKGGYMDGRPLTVAEVERIADLESREVLLARLAGAMKGNLTKAAGLFNAPASNLARLMAALQDKMASQEPAAAPEPAAEPQSAVEPGPAAEPESAVEPGPAVEPEPAVAEVAAGPDAAEPEPAVAEVAAGPDAAEPEPAVAEPAAE
jgi:large subunit ribosomal protein L10